MSVDLVLEIKIWEFLLTAEVQKERQTRHHRSHHRNHQWAEGPHHHRSLKLISVLEQRSQNRRGKHTASGPLTAKAASGAGTTAGVVTEALSAESTSWEAAGEAAGNTRVVSTRAAGEAAAEATSSGGEWDGVSAGRDREVGAGGGLVLGGDHGQEDGGDEGGDLDHLD